MYEIDAASGRSAAGSIIKQAYAPVTQLRGYGFDIGNPVCQLLDSLSVAVKEFGDRRIRRERCQQLNAGVGVADRQHRFADSLVFVDFLDRKSTRLNSSHVAISYAVFCLKKKK